MPGLIGAIVTEAGQKPAVGSPFRPEALRDSLRGVIATSAISHGVDVDEFNMMFFAGQPADIAEYIQASSRVGRTHVGTSVLIPTPQQRRDRYIVEIHDIFHRFLERMIDAAPVERWAENAITRTLASFLQLKLCGVDYIRNMSCARDNVQKASLAEPDNVGEIGERSRTDHINLLDELRQFVVDGIGLEHDTSPLNKDFYKQRINQLFHRATTAMEQSNWRTENLDSFFRQPGAPLTRPMTSLRDVNEAGLDRRRLWKRLRPHSNERSGSRDVRTYAGEQQLDGRGNRGMRTMARQPADSGPRSGRQRAFDEPVPGANRDELCARATLHV